MAEISDQAVAMTEESRRYRFAAKLTPLRAGDRVFYLYSPNFMHWIYCYSLIYRNKMNEYCFYIAIFTLRPQRTTATVGLAFYPLGKRRVRSMPILSAGPNAGQTLTLSRDLAFLLR